jgi:hypothetical protein
MASTRTDRELHRARTRYVGTANALVAAVHAWNGLAVPVLPDSASAELPAWTDEQIRATEAVAKGWRDLVVARREYEALRRDVAG